MIKIVLTLGLFLATVAECSPLKRGYKIFGGVKMSTWADNPFKFIVMLHGKGICTGSIFNTKTVLSAGHCFVDINLISNEITLEHMSTKGAIPKSIEIEQAFMPAAYQSKPGVGGDDLAVVRLKTPINFGSSAHTVLKFSKSQLGVGIDIIIVGYGGDSSKNEKAGALRHGKAMTSTCFFKSPDKRVCANPQPRFANQISEGGDSGMPLLTEKNGDYIGHGVFNGILSYPNGIRNMIFAPYDKHEKFIKTHAGSP